jgi:two-component system osmolarity sensor histidine kinase EnvZ
VRLQLALMEDDADHKAIRQDIDEMEDMIDGYLSFAAGEGEEPTVEVEVDKMLSRLVSQAAKAHNFDITFEDPDPAIPPFSIRRNAIQRAFSNIISNAVRYSTKTVVTVRVRNDEITFIFDDNGAGIPEELRADAVRPFIRLEESRNRKTGGTGLGLSIASDIVLGHGGELTLLNSPLGGLRVTIKLPM